MLPLMMLLPSAMHLKQSAQNTSLVSPCMQYGLQVCTQESWDTLMSKFAELAEELPEEGLTQVYQVHSRSAVWLYLHSSSRQIASKMRCSVGFSMSSPEHTAFFPCSVTLNMHAACVCQAASLVVGSPVVDDGSIGKAAA